MLRCGEGHFKRNNAFSLYDINVQTLAPQFMAEKLLLNTNEPQPFLLNTCLRVGGDEFHNMSSPSNAVFSYQTSLMHEVLKKEYNMMNC